MGDIGIPTLFTGANEAGSTGKSCNMIGTDLMRLCVIQRGLALVIHIRIGTYARWSAIEPFASFSPRLVPGGYCCWNPPQLLPRSPVLQPPGENPLWN